MRWTICAVLFLSTMCWAADATVERQAAMRGAFQALVGIQPYLATDAKWRDKKNAAKILEMLEAIRHVEHVFPAAEPKGKNSGQVMVQLFGRYMSDVPNRFEKGEYDLARYRVKTVGSLCFGCHLGSKTDVSFADMGKEVEALNLRPIERAEFFAATRQFDAALTVYKDILLTPPSTERENIQFSRALRDAMNILVRVKGDAHLTATFLNQINTNGLQPFHQDAVKVWLKDAKAWEREKFDTAKASPAKLLEKGRDLCRKAHSESDFWPDARKDFLNMRATAYLNLALDRGVGDVAEAYYWLGTSSAGLRDSSLWELDGLYFEACIRQSAHSAVARKCFRQLESRTVVAFTGSRGTNIPEDEIEHLAELRKLAQ